MAFKSATCILLILFTLSQKHFKESKFEEYQNNIKRRIEYIKKEPLKEDIYKSIINHSGYYNINPNLVIAILAQESMFRNGIRNNQDYGIAQINIVNIRKLKLDKYKVQYNYDYCIRIMCYLLADLKQRYGHEKYWWTRYNSGKSEKRIQYKKNVIRFLHI